MNHVMEVATAVSVLIGALAFLSGVSAWKREFVGKRRIELAESVLAVFYEAEDAIREIRSPFSHEGEGRSRKRSRNETEEESRILDQAYVVFERYQKREQLFAQLRSMRYRFMAAFGAEAGEPFEEVARVVREILVAAQMLGKHYWLRQGRVQMTEQEFKKHLDEMQKREAILWITTRDEDGISPRVRAAVRRVEDTAQRAADAKSGWGWPW